MANSFVFCVMVASLLVTGCVGLPAAGPSGGPSGGSPSGGAPLGGPPGATSPQIIYKFTSAKQVAADKAFGAQGEQTTSSRPTLNESPPPSRVITLNLSERDRVTFHVERRDPRVDSIHVAFKMPPIVNATNGSASYDGPLSDAGLDLTLTLHGVATGDGQIIVYFSIAGESVTQRGPSLDYKVR